MSLSLGSRPPVTPRKIFLVMVAVSVMVSASHDADIPSSGAFGVGCCMSRRGGVLHVPKR